MPSAEKCFADGHEVCDAVGAIADELVQDGGEEGHGFGMVEAEAAGETALSEGAQVGEGEFVDLGGSGVSSGLTARWPSSSGFCGEHLNRACSRDDEIGKDVPPLAPIAF